MSMSSDKWEIIHIPGNPPISPGQQPTVNILASVIDPKIANALVRRLNQIAPLEHLRHVKRVCRRHLESGKFQLSVILCPACEDGRDVERMPEDVLELVKSYQLSAFTAKVCKYSATSKEEWEEQCKLWPTSFHPPTYNIEGISGFTGDQSKVVFNFMMFALELARSDEGQVVNAAVIVDPCANEVISSARDHVYSCNTPKNDCIKTSSCQHAKSMAFHPFANGSSSFVELHSFVDSQKFASISCLQPWEWYIGQPYSSHWNPLRHAAMVAIEVSAARDMRLFPEIANNNEEEFTLREVLETSTASPSKKQKTHSAKFVNEEHSSSIAFYSKADRPYLCTGYDIYLAWEPCIMCAMAIVHQRVRRVFYAFPNLTAGALGSIHRLHGEKSLNHHYAVFRVVLPDEVVLGMQS
ncbi:hypothetical protein Dimus_008578 [Dionaea muscipula]